MKMSLCMGEVTEKGQTWVIFNYQGEGSRTGR